MCYPKARKAISYLLMRTIIGLTFTPSSSMNAVTAYFNIPMEGVGLFQRRPFRGKDPFPVNLYAACHQRHKYNATVKAMNLPPKI